MFDFTFGEWLKRQRKIAGFTQEQLAEQVGCAVITLRKIEAEERRPSEQIVARLAETFQISQNERKDFLRFARGRVDLAPSASPAAVPWNLTTVPRIGLPATVTSLVGRADERATLREYWPQADTRLVTLIGPPGIGKTRLSIAAARDAADHFPDGVFFIALAPLERPNLILPTIFQALGYAERGDQSVERLGKDIGDKRLLLVLDNVEHLLEDVAALASCLLSACPRLKILATSREAMRVPGEWLFPIPALTLPSADAVVNVDTATQFPALTLFAERARAVRLDFKLMPENVQAVASICRQLDGLPLAIELIAARIRLMSPQTLLERMTSEFVLSADGMRAVAARQKTLHNAIGWSYNLLSPEEQKGFAWLAVFSEGFTLDAAETILAPTAPNKPISDLIALLSDKSLLRPSLDERGEVRFYMLVTLGKFALDLLHRSGDEKRVRDLHLDYFLSLAETGDWELRGSRQVEWAQRIQEEQNNMRAALEWAVSSRQTEAALRLLCALGWPWEIRGHYNEAANWLERIRALPDVNEYPSLLSRILSHIGRYHWTQDRFREARLLLEESRAIAAQMGPTGEKELANALNWLALDQMENDQDGARSALEQSLEISAKHGDDWGIALSAFHLGILEKNLGHRDAALSLLEKSLSIFQRYGDLFFIARVSIFLGYAFESQGDYAQARQFFEKQLQIDTQLNFWDGIASGWLNLGNLARRRGDVEQAQACYARVRSIGREHGLAVGNLPEQNL